MPAPSLPNEIIAKIVDRLPRDALVSASCVCKTWYFLVLPILYDSVSVGRHRHIKQLLRVFAGNNVLTSPISAYIHHLCFNCTIENTKYTNSLLIQLEPLILRLSQLQELSWGVGFIPEDLVFMKAFQTQCLQLRKVQLVIPDRFVVSTEKGKSSFATLLGFKNLDSFTLEVLPFPTDFHAHLLHPLKAFIMSSPELRVLKLDFKYNPITPEHFAASMGTEFTLPRLQTFHLGGGPDYYEGDINSPTPSGSGANHFLDFLSRHPLLKDIKLDCTFLRQFCDNVNSDVLARALPALEQFSGPYFFWDCLVPSEIAARLTSLTINRWELDPENSLELVISNKGLKLPALRTLDISIEEFPKAMDILGSITSAASGLEELFFPAILQEYHADFLYFLSHTPEIQQVHLWNYGDGFSSKGTPSPNGFFRIELIAAMHDMYPKLLVKCDGEWE
ncbi:unnamed protein product [Rhizoctonia solani]|uniref:F-box domain-containing protein n=1 Tax=Rhizoctonia solani TaxID=456999 RepID=A0A8H3HZZ3_9AGAM|nr:unnamed protein product [Rhizoctonia solani]